MPAGAARLASFVPILEVRQARSIRTIDRSDEALALVRIPFSRHTFPMIPDSDSAYARASASAHEEFIRRSEEHQLLLNRRTRKMQWVFLFSVLSLVAVFFAQSDAQLFSIAGAWLLIVLAVAAAPGRCFIKDHPGVAPSGPRPALRKQPPAAPARLRAWPVLEGPHPPLPSSERLPHERTES